MDLTELRDKIDAIDTELVRLFTERMDIAAKVADYKKENNLPIIISQTETALIIPVLETPDGALDIWGNNNIWREAFINRKNLQTGFLKFYNI